MYFREVADGNLREKNCEVRLSIFFLWPNRFWPFSLPDQRTHNIILLVIQFRRTFIFLNCIASINDETLACNVRGFL